MCYISNTVFVIWHFSGIRFSQHVSTQRGVCLYVCIHMFSFYSGCEHTYVYVCVCILLYDFGNFKDKQFLVVFPSLSLLLYFSRIANWLFLVHACDFASFCFGLFRKNKSMHTLPARQLMSIQCSLSPPLACAGSLPQQQPTLSAHANNFACVYVCMNVHIYERVSHFSALRSPPSPPLCACYTQYKKLIASLR